MKTIACVIPARLGSTRFPKKILAYLQDKPLIQWVWEAACKVNLFESVTVAVDSEEAAHIIQNFGADTIMTSPECQNGTYRVCESVICQKTSADIIVNWQADEPFIHQKMIEHLLQSTQHDEADIWTLKKKISHPLQIQSPHRVKVVCDKQDMALYFSRHPIPFNQSCYPLHYYYQHIGLYAYTKTALLKISSLPISFLSETEQLEQLNFLYHGMKIRVHETCYESLGIDTPQDLEEAHHLLNSSTLIKK